MIKGKMAFPKFATVDIIAILVICLSLGIIRVARAMPRGNIGPYAKPVPLVNMLSAITEGTCQTKICRASAMTE